MKKIQKGIIKNIEKIALDTFALEISSNVLEAHSGQFISILCPPKTLRRPFSIKGFKDGVIEVFFKLKGEQRSGRDDGDGVCDRLGEEYREHIILHELRKDEDQRDEDDDLAEDSEEGADLGIAESDECLLAGNLDAHQKDGGHVDAQRPDGDLAQLRLIGKDGDEQ